MRAQCLKGGSVNFEHLFNRYSQWCIDKNKKWMNEEQAKKSLKRWMNINVNKQGVIKGRRFRINSPDLSKLDSTFLFLKYGKDVSPDGSGSMFVNYDNLNSLYNDFCVNNFLKKEDLRQRLVSKGFVILKSSLSQTFEVYGLKINPPRRPSLAERFTRFINRKPGSKNVKPEQPKNFEEKIEENRERKDIVVMEEIELKDDVSAEQPSTQQKINISKNITFSKFVEMYTEKGGCVNFDTLVSLSKKTNKTVVRELKKLGYPILSGTIIGLSIRNSYQTNVDVFIYSSPNLRKQDDAVCFIDELQALYLSFCKDNKILNVERKQFIDDLLSLGYKTLNEKVYGISIGKVSNDERKTDNLTITARTYNSMISIKQISKDFFETIELSSNNKNKNSFDIKAGAIALFAQRLRYLDDNIKRSDLSYIIVRYQLYLLDEVDDITETIKILKEWNLIVVSTPLATGNFVVSKTTYEKFKEQLLFEDVKQSKTKSAKEVDCYRLLRNTYDDLINQYKIVLKNGTVYNVDMYSQKSNTVIEFLGDFYHGNPHVFKKDDLNSMLNKTYGKLYDETMERLTSLKDEGYNVIYVWEKDWNKRSEDHSSFLKTM
jgi:hypothetical protein